MDWARYSEAVQTLPNNRHFNEEETMSKDKEMLLPEELPEAAALKAV